MCPDTGGAGWSWRPNCHLCARTPAAPASRGGRLVTDPLGRVGYGRAASAVSPICPDASATRQAVAVVSPMCPDTGGAGKPGGGLVTDPLGRVGYGRAASALSPMCPDASATQASGGGRVTHVPGCARRRRVAATELSPMCPDTGCVGNPGRRVCHRSTRTGGDGQAASALSPMCPDAGCFGESRRWNCHPSARTRGSSLTWGLAVPGLGASQRGVHRGVGAGRGWADVRASARGGQREGVQFRFVAWSRRCRGAVLRRRPFGVCGCVAFVSEWGARDGARMQWCPSPASMPSSGFDEQRGSAACDGGTEFRFGARAWSITG